MGPLVADKIRGRGKKGCIIGIDPDKIPVCLGFVYGIIFPYFVLCTLSSLIP